MLDSLRGTALFKAEGTNIYKFINSIRENNMVCTDQHCKKGAFYGRVYRSDMKRLEDLAESCDIKIEFVERKGFRFRLFS